MNFKRIAAKFVLVGALAGGGLVTSSGATFATATPKVVTHAASAAPSPRVSGHVQWFNPRPRVQVGLSYDRGVHIWLKFSRADVLGGLVGGACFSAANSLLPPPGGQYVARVTCWTIALAVKAFAAKYISGGYWIAVWPSGYYEYGAY